MGVLRSVTHPIYPRDRNDRIRGVSLFLDGPLEVTIVQLHLEWG
jgi:hypothetical protein